jgi:chloramphenicol-sensitive protein RarD
MSPAPREEAIGTVTAAASFLIWGILPLYWKTLRGIPPVDILMNRLFWAFVISGVLLAVGVGRRTALEALRSKRTMVIMVYRSLLLGVNWYIYIWAVTSGFILDASLGYYINPLFHVALGIVVLHERLTRTQAAAFLLAGAGVLYATFRAGVFPWISISLSLTFGLYALSKKRCRVDSLPALGIEMGILTPVAIVFFIVGMVNGTSPFMTESAGTIVLLICAGAATVAPLLLFSAGTKRIPLSRLGFLQYIAPTGMLIIGIFADGQEFTVDRAITFGCIWTALAIYSVSLRRSPRRRALEREGP